MIILVGASASGKSVVVKQMMENYSMKKVVTYTTRPMRVGEVNGIDYHFVSKGEFLEKQNNNFFLETAFYNDNYYGTAFEDISKDKVLIVEPKGANVYTEKLKDKVFIVYLKASEESRKQRMLERGDTLESITKRLQGDKQYFELSNFKKIDLIIETDNITISQTADIIYNKYKQIFN